LAAHGVQDSAFVEFGKYILIPAAQEQLAKELLPVSDGEFPGQIVQAMFPVSTL